LKYSLITIILQLKNLYLKQSFFGIEYYNSTLQLADDKFNLTAALLSAGSDGNTTSAADTPQLDDEEEASGNTTTTTKKTSTKPKRDDQKASLPSSDAVLPRVTNMKEAKMLVLQFRAEHQDNWTSSVVKKYELDMVNKFEK
jgi:hypothetical protein